MQKQLFILSVIVFLSLTVSAQNSEFEAWKINREKELLAEEGWLNLAGLYWITETTAFLNIHGKDSLNLSHEATKNTLGSFEVKGDSVWFNFHPSLTKRKSIQPSKKVLQFPETAYGSGAVYHDRWKWNVISRGGQFAVRLRDLKHTAIADFQSIPYFEYDSAFVTEAFFIPKFNETINIPNVLGQVIEWKVMGLLQFEIGRKRYELTALDEAGKLFVIFSDLTNDKDTYPAGRYLYVDYPDQKGKTQIDFNYSYNPPCAFTPFATCPIPPKVNRLELAVKAGEKKPVGHK